MNTTYVELNNRIKFLTKEIEKTVDILAYMLCSEDTMEEEYAAYEAKLVEMTDELESATKYAFRLALLN